MSRQTPNQPRTHFLFALAQRLTVYNAIRYLKREGLWRSFHAFLERYSVPLWGHDSYRRWILKNEPDLVALKAQEMLSLQFRLKPKISIIAPVYNPDRTALIEMIQSVMNQTYQNWELCLADGSSHPHVKPIIERYAKNDPRIKVRYLTVNDGIANNSNVALSLSQGDFIALLDHDDTLAPFALFELVKAINADPSADFLYSDEDKLSEDGNRRFSPHFKPQWSPDTLRSYNYITHLTAIRHNLLDQVGWFSEAYDGSQDYDLILRATEKATTIVHIPSVLYHWRVSSRSAARNAHAKPYAYDSAKKALNAHLKRIGLEGEATDGAFLGSYVINYALARHPLVSIIIPTKDNVRILRHCIRSIQQKTTYKHHEIILVDTQSLAPGTFDYYDEISRTGNIRVIRWNESFNYSAVNNFAVNHTRGDVLLFLNNDTEVINFDWLERLLEYATRKDVGAVGAQLCYPNNTIQHAGLILGVGGIAGHSHKGFRRTSHGQFYRLQVVQNISAVTGACLMIRREVFEEVGGFDSILALAFNDVDLCLKLRSKGYLIVYTPLAKLYHHESKTRGYEDTPEKQERFRTEIEYFRGKWEHLLDKGDPYYNPHLTLEREDFSIKV